MGVGSRVFGTFLCNSCGREIIAEEGQSVDGYYLEVLRVQNGEQISSENIFACSEACIHRAVRDGLSLESLPEEQKVREIQRLWERGRRLSTAPIFPVLDVSNENRVLGTAREITSPSSTGTNPLDPHWTPQ